MEASILEDILNEHKVWIDSIGVSGSQACLSDESLRGVNLSHKDLSGADLGGANLIYADLSFSNLSGANLIDADLRGADLRGCDLRMADLSEAKLIGTSLIEADLRGATLPYQTHIIMGMDYPITIYNGTHLRVGIENHSIDEWRGYSKLKISEMDGSKLLKFYPRLLDVIEFYIGKGNRPDWID